MKTNSLTGKVWQHVKPVIVSLTPDLAEKYLGNPKKEKGYTLDGDLEEWLAIADCYFQALAEE